MPLHKTRHHAAGLPAALAALCLSLALGGCGGGGGGGGTPTPQNPVPSVTSISPTSASAGDAALTLTVTGSSFIAGSIVRWNGANRTTTFGSATQLTAAISAGDLAAGAAVSVTVFNPAPGGGTSAAATFTINNPVPTLTSISPNSATAGGAAFTLTATGTNFVSNSVVRWNGANRTTTFVSATEITAAIAASDIAAGGAVQVTVLNPAPAGGTTAAQTFTANNPVPTLASLVPNSAFAGGAAFNLTVNGTNFVSNSVVRWNGANRTTTCINSTQLTAAIPASDITTVSNAQVTVFNPAPAGGTSGGSNFTISAVAPLTIGTSLLPPTSGGKAYNFTLAVLDGAAPHIWNISAGVLPGGLSIDGATGRISGTPAAVLADTPFNFTARVTDSSVPMRTGTRALTITVRPAGNLGRNDSCSGGVGGTSISNGRIRASISPYGDVDVYSFHGTAGKEVTIEIFAQRLNLDGIFGTRDSQMDSLLELLASACPDAQASGANTIGFNDDLAIPPDEHVQDSLIRVSSSPFPAVTDAAGKRPPTALPTTGTYFIRVRDFRGDGRPDLVYELVLSGAD